MSEPGPQAASGPTGPPHCYRHPDRETYIRCVRCERPICPDDMVPVAVGFLCPDDARAGRQGVRQPRTLFGGRVSDDPGWVSKVLIGVNVAVFLLQQVQPTLERRFWLVAGPVADEGLGFATVGVADGELYRLVTAAFLHGGLLHLLFNMYALWLFGPPLEQAFGRVRFAALYLLSALGGSAASYGFGERYVPALGASGAVFGLFAAYIVVSRRLGREVSGLFVLLGINVVIGFLPGSNIDWRAHAGGFVLGGLLTLALVLVPRRLRGVLHPVAFAVALALVVAAVVWRTAELDGASTARVAACTVTAPLDPGEAFLDCVGAAGG
ncbi:rhomboid family intramembrane serine protease [Vallicoccus soli]|uniref:Rhomboid family intramembrane serine protease n=1 Tax=Vallicoccus soli TaxID=2339232 RepID=A0A3A3YWS7_9ACTN|nr:rhomboid family intramembrane serine protease [Vallicoccus soli]RJK94718.1 rhomboid family intramembrane serine protease [Vallicoccus soli]